MRGLLFVVILFFCGAPSFGQAAYPSYYSVSEFSLASPGAMKFGLYGYDNPAVLSSLHQPDFLFTWTDAVGSWSDFNRWGLFTAVPHLGFGMVKTKAGNASVTDYRIAAAFGGGALSTGVALGWSGGDRTRFGRTNLVALGVLARPDRHLSVGLIGTTAGGGDAKEAVIDLGMRPLGNELVTAFADYGIRTGQSWKDGNWSLGAAVEPFSGVRLTGRYFDTKAFAMGVEISLGRAGLSTRAAFDSDGKHSHNTYGIRLGAYDRAVTAGMAQRSGYLEMNLVGPLKYQRFVLFDEGNTLRRLLAVIDAAKEDRSIGGIAINATGMRAHRELLWEVREKLKEFRAAGKRVVIFIDRPDIDEYHFASVADRIVMDPVGIITLEGFISGRTFYRGMLEKLGIGFDEWRFFPYKSALESLSRDSMTSADREQRKELLEEFYRGARRDICEGRGFTPEEFDGLVNEVFLFLSQDALERGLVDTLGRWDAVSAMVGELEGRNIPFRDARTLERFNLPGDHRWGEKPRIAVIYALGVCAMDVGITARKLVKDVEAAVRDPGVRAIVLRVDSPGGDGMASDYIAEALRKAKGKKPVIVSQGAVAASGGYWLSMYGDHILAAPVTITGSIGVIGGWAYNKDLKEKLGMTTDLVKVGRFADLGFTFALPFLGVGLPDRNLTQEERAKMERGIRTFYEEFVKKVTEGRAMDYARVEEIAGGRVWSGTAAKARGLVDEIGGLDKAIARARMEANIPFGENVEIIEYPKPGLVDFGRLLPGPFQSRDLSEDQDIIDHLLFRLKHNGQPLLMLPLEEMEAVIQ